MVGGGALIGWLHPQPAPEQNAAVVALNGPLLGFGGSPYPANHFVSGSAHVCWHQSGIATLCHFEDSERRGIGWSGRRLTPWQAREAGQRLECESAGVGSGANSRRCRP